MGKFLFCSSKALHINVLTKFSPVFFYFLYTIQLRIKSYLKDINFIRIKLPLTDTFFCLFIRIVQIFNTLYKMLIRHEINIFICQLLANFKGYKAIITINTLGLPKAIIYWNKDV
jgi:hypothetical protein